MAYLAIYSDPQGLPRAWAKSEDRVQAEASAYLELEAYRDKKRVVGDPLATADFTLEVKMCR